MNNTSAETSYVSVLIVTNETSLHDVLSLGMKKKGFNVTCVHDKASAVRLLKEKTFDLAVCDLMIDGSSDAEFVDMLKTVSPETEVILASGFSSLERSTESNDGQSFDYIARPFSISHLSGIIDRAMEKKRLRAQVAHLADVNRWKMELMWTLGHELRTPMTAIMGFTSLHLAGLYGPMTAEQEENLRRVKNGADTILQLLSNILDMSVLTVDRMPLNQDVFNLTDFAKEVLSSLESLVHTKKLYLSLDAPAELWMKTDRVRLRQVLVNLIGNAIKFTDDGGVTVRLSLSNPDTAHIEVRDTGMGIRTEDLPKLFCEFSQVSVNTAARQGTGLGLAISKKTIELLGGTVGVESEFGTGSAFSVDLPVGLLARVSQRIEVAAAN